MLDHFQVIWTWNARVIIVVTACLCQGSKSHSFLHSNLTFVEVSGMLMLNRFRLYLSNKFLLFCLRPWFFKVIFNLVEHVNFPGWHNEYIWRRWKKYFSCVDFLNYSHATKMASNNFAGYIISFLFFSFHFISWNSIVQFYCIGGKGEGGAREIKYQQSEINGNS